MVGLEWYVARICECEVGGYIFYWKKSRRNGSHGRPRRWWDNHVKVIFKESGYKNVNRIQPW